MRTVSRKQPIATRHAQYSGQFGNFTLFYLVDVDGGDGHTVLSDRHDVQTMIRVRPISHFAGEENGDLSLLSYYHIFRQMIGGRLSWIAQQFG